MEGAKMKEIKSILKKKDEFWQITEQELSDEQFYKNKKKDFEYKYQNCLIISLARFLKFNNYKEVEGLKNKEILDFVKENFTDKSERKIENEIGFITLTKNISLIQSARKIEVNTELYQFDIDYISQFSNCLVVQKYKDREAHFQFFENAKELINSEELSIEFETMLIFLN